MKHTFDSYIKNPGGKGSSITTQKDMMMKIYSEKLDVILLRENGKVSYDTFKYKDKFYLYFKIYSEVVPNFKYDTIIEFRASDPVKAFTAQTLNTYNVRFYSNDGAFVFTYAYAFNKADLLIKDLIPKLPKNITKEKAKVRNPKSAIGYVKSLFFAYILYQRYGLNAKSKYREVTKSEFDSILSKVEQAETKIDRRNELGRKYTSHKTDKPKEKKTDEHASKKSSLVGVVKKTKTTSTTKRSKSSKRI